MTYYNEHDPFAASWLRALIGRELLSAGDVDERDIRSVTANDLAGYRQCHFFAGIGGWPLALQLAGWPAERPVWTGSCPCQPYSVGSVAHGGAKGQSDERHLWPVFFALIRQRKPPTLFGEQVQAAIEWGWWDEVSLDLEGEAYAVASAVIPACFAAADHERKRLFWVADSNGAGRQGHQPLECVSESAQEAFPVNGNPLVGARRALAGDYSGLLPCDGVSVQLERDAVKCYGNALVPEIAAEFIRAYQQLRP